MIPISTWSTERWTSQVTFIKTTSPHEIVTLLAQLQHCFNKNTVLLTCECASYTQIYSGSFSFSIFSFSLMSVAKCFIELVNMNYLLKYTDIQASINQVQAIFRRKNSYQYAQMMYPPGQFLFFFTLPGPCQSHNNKFWPSSNFLYVFWQNVQQLPVQLRGLIHSKHRSPTYLSSKLELKIELLIIKITNRSTEVE